MVKDIICVACPMGCQISVELNDDGEILMPVPLYPWKHGNRLLHESFEFPVTLQHDFFAFGVEL